ncbi:MAG TPA: hypothetical protein VK933_05085 [Longimicrobiales bacterium]|nr:hypothetical protein [Longimicrobiales bacterium]
MRLRGVVVLVFGFIAALRTDAVAQQRWFPAPDAERSFGPNAISIDLAVLGASIAYSRQGSHGVALGLAVGAGATTGVMFSSGELTGDGSTPLFVELLSGSAFLRGQVGARTEIEGALRVGWFYHPPTEFETIFTGASADLRYRIGAVRVGPRIYLGRVSEEGGRSQAGMAIVPLLATWRWTW